MIREPNCFKRQCIHFLGVVSDGEEELNERPVCAAFPDGIPHDIAYGDVQHTEPFPGDHGILFEEKPSA